MTKIEVLSVVLAIGVCGSLAASAVLTARLHTRDATRLSHVRELQDSLESYFTDHAGYPVSSDPLALGQGSTQCLSGTGFACSIAPADSYLRVVPTPPTTGLKKQSTCSGVANVYCYSGNATSYHLQFELEAANKTLGLAKGANCITESTLISGACPSL
jgi:Tfp pilus assembly protein PilE